MHEGKQALFNEDSSNDSNEKMEKLKGWLMHEREA